MNYTKLFAYLDREYSIIRDAKALPMKEVYTGANSAQYTNILHGQDSEGYIAVKMIHVNEESRQTKSTILLKEPDSELLITIDGNFLTTFRTALNAAYAVFKTTTPEDNILFIGGGRINLFTAKILSDIGYKKFRIIGGRSDVDKNRRYFEAATGCAFNTFSEDNATVIVSCTNNNDLNNLYSAWEFPSILVHIASDTGYSLDPSFRVADVDLYSDCPEHLFKHHEFEFPLDSKQHIFTGLHRLGKDKLVWPVGVYLYGNIISDILAARNRNEIYSEFLQYAIL